MIDSMMALVVPGLAAAIALPVFHVLKKNLIPGLDRLPAFVKQMAVVVIAGVLMWVGSLTGVELPGELGQITTGNIETLAAAALAFLGHSATKGLRKDDDSAGKT